MIGAEVLSRSLNALPQHRSFRPFKVPSGCPLVTHLAYADDVVIFTIGLKTSVKLVKGVVDGYCEVSGQKVNCQKSCFLVHPALPPQRRSMIGTVTGFSHKTFPCKYLGCLLFIGRRRTSYFAEVCNAVTTRILSWRHRILSTGGKIVLLRSVLSSMPVHLLAAASPPRRIFSLLEKVMADFLWGSTDLGPKFHWISWSDLCRPQGEGGIGVRSLTKLYDAFSVKLWWKFRQQQSLWATFLAAKYCKGVHPCLAEDAFHSRPCGGGYVQFSI